MQSGGSDEDCRCDRWRTAVAETPLDVGRIGERRVQLGLSQRELARIVGLNSAAVSQLERGRGQEELTVRVLGRIAEALGLSIGALFSAAGGKTPSGVGASPGSDDLLVEAVLHTAKFAVTSERLSTVLGWELARTRRAIKALQGRLAGSGVVVHWQPNGWTIQPRGDLLTADQTAQLERTRMRTRQICEPAMRLLRLIALDGLEKNRAKHLGEADRVSLLTFIKSGLVVEEPERFVPSETLIKSLRL